MKGECYELFCSGNELINVINGQLAEVVSIIKEEIGVYRIIFKI